MNKQQRATVLRQLTPATWYTYCVMEASYETAEITETKAKLAAKLNISVPTLNKYLTAWETVGLIQRKPGGFIITQLGEAASELKPKAANRLVPKDVIAYWCKKYEEHYYTPYYVSNWGLATAQAKMLLAVYSDEDVKGVIDVVMRLYESKWASPNYPRPTLGQLSSWLAQQALPYVERREDAKDEETGAGESLLADLESKGWI